MTETLREEDWDVLVQRVQSGTCTPILGAGAGYGILPLGADIARAWAQKFNYPLEDSYDLARVAQFLALKHDAVFPKTKLVEEFQEYFRQGKVPDFKDPSDPHSTLARFPLPIFITTNYDDFLVRALRLRHKDPVRELCRWNTLLERRPSVFDAKPDYVPSVANPLVFHLHGYVPLETSLVLTEDDYLDFLVNTARNRRLLPPAVEDALMGTSLLFIGYRIADWNFRVLLRGLSRFLDRSLRRLNVAVMLPPERSETTEQHVQDYLTEYYKNIDVKVYWGDLRVFLRKLKELVGDV